MRERFHRTLLLWIIGALAIGSSAAHGAEAPKRVGFIVWGTPSARGDL
jgi:hypothetical protein